MPGKFYTPDEWKAESSKRNKAENGGRYTPEEKQRRKEDRAAGKPIKKKRLTLVEIYQFAETVVSNSFPDGDPIDYIGPHMKLHGYDIQDLNRAVKGQTSAKSYHDWLARMWEDFAGDQLSDSMNAKTISDFADNFVEEDNGNFRLKDNPWWSKEEQEKARSKRT